MLLLQWLLVLVLGGRAGAAQPTERRAGGEGHGPPPGPGGEAQDSPRPGGEGQDSPRPGGEGQSGLAAGQYAPGPLPPEGLELVVLGG